MLNKFFNKLIDIKYISQLYDQAHEGIWNEGIKDNENENHSKCIPIRGWPHKRGW